MIKATVKSSEIDQNIEVQFTPLEIERGYANRTLYVNLSQGKIESKPVTDEMKAKFIGGKGFDLWLMWNALPKDRIVKWNDPENEICIANGPLGGSSLIPGSGKCIVTTISPLTGIIIDSNVGGYFGGYLKQAGFDALEIQGKATEPVLIIIDAPTYTVRIEPAPADLPEHSHLLTQVLTEKYAPTPEDKTLVSVITTGPGSKTTNWGVLNFSWYAPKRKWASYKQAGRGGIGTVFADKNIKAIVVRAPKPFRSIHPVDVETIKKVGGEHIREIIEHDPHQNEVRAVGTAHLPEIMDEYDLLPTENYRFGHHPTAKAEQHPYHREVWRKIFTDTGKGQDGCWWGCPLNCSHYTNSHVVLTGSYKGQTVVVDGPEYETIAGCGSNWGVWDPKIVLETNFYCDLYGLDTISVGTGIAFVMECFEAGIIDSKITEGLDLRFGNGLAAIELIHKMVQGTPFGKIVGLGIKQMKAYFVEHFSADPAFVHDIGMEHKGLEFSEYISKESLTQQGGYCMTLKGPQHDEAWLIFEDMVRNSIPTFEDKANALCWFPYWRTWFGLNGLCKILWNDVQPPDNKNNPLKDANGHLYRARVPKHVEWYAKYSTAVTGRPVNTDDLIVDSRRVYNFQRIFNIRQGKGLAEHDAHVPYRAMGPVTPAEYNAKPERFDKQLKEVVGVDPSGKSVEEKIALLRKFREDQYAQLQKMVYQKRGWSEKGCPTIMTVKELGIDFPDVLSLIQPYQ
jgi:aldehyde:ferredoxin oxidoreductase